MKRGQKQQISLHKHKTRSIRTEDRSHRPGWCYVTLTPCKRTEGRSHRPGWRYVTLTPCKRAEDRSHRPSWRYVTLTPTKRREGRNKGPSSSRCPPNRNERPFGQWSYSNRWKFSRSSTIANNTIESCCPGDPSVHLHVETKTRILKGLLGFQTLNFTLVSCSSKVCFPK